MIDYVVKTIVIAGAHSRIGKTTLAHSIVELLPDAQFVKLGSHGKKDTKKDTLYTVDTTFKHLLDIHGNAQYLIIESNKILQEITPDCTIFLPGEPAKPSAAMAREKADLIRGCAVDQKTVDRLAQNLVLSEKVIRKIAWLSGSRPSSATAIILAGGKSSRMGADKSLLKINGEHSIFHLHKILEPYFNEILVSVSDRNDSKFNSLKIVKDIDIGFSSPLLGIYSALKESHSYHNFIIACDIPKIHFPLVFQMLAIIEDYEIVVPSFEKGFFEPLFALYSAQCIHKIKSLLDLKIKRVNVIFSECHTHILPVKDKSWYFNLNTKTDYHSFLNQTAVEMKSRCE